MRDRYGDPVEEPGPEVWSPGEREAWRIAHCPLCDDDGYRGCVPCDHVDRAAIAARGLARVREALSSNHTTRPVTDAQEGAQTGGTGGAA